VQVYNATSGALIAKGVTNGTGFVHFLIRANASIVYTVYAVNPMNKSEVYTANKSLVMVHHFYFVHTVPWVSKYYAPEVAVVDVDLAIHRGQGYYYGNVSHLVVYSIWTNKPQNVTVFIALYNMSSSTPTLINSKVVNLTLSEGVNTFMDWISVNISRLTHVRAFVNITRWQYDTDPSNNYMWSPERVLKPFTDFQIIVVWSLKQAKQRWTILPEDIIEIDIGVIIPINTTSIPLKLNYSISAKDLKLKVFKPITSKYEEIRAIAPGIIWRNFTVTVPWTSKLIINASIYHDLDDVGSNNYITITIPIDPDVKLSVTKFTSFAVEGGTISITVYLKSNVEPEINASAWLNVVDVNTQTLLKHIDVAVVPEETVTVSIAAPQNSPAFWFIRKPTETHTFNVSVVGYDVYLADNSQSINVTVISYQWILAIVIIAIIIVLVGVLIRVITKSIIISIEEEERVFVKRKKFVHRKE
jgi:hypothetical protein